MASKAGSRGISCHLPNAFQSVRYVPLHKLMSLMMFVPLNFKSICVYAIPSPVDVATDVSTIYISFPLPYFFLFFQITKYATRTKYATPARAINVGSRSNFCFCFISKWYVNDAANYMKRKFEFSILMFQNLKSAVFVST